MPEVAFTEKELQMRVEAATKELKEQLV